MTSLQTQVLIIGGGATGTGLARDLALRGISSILVEKRDINAGASGGNHGLLHSGARYIAGDVESARECHEEGTLLKKLAPHCIEDTGGLFVAVEGDDEKYVADFPSMCDNAGLPYQEVDLKEAREMEPVISEKAIAVYAVQDASIDPFKLSLENMQEAVRLGATYLRMTKVVGFDVKNKHITRVILREEHTGDEIFIEAEQVVNAAGAWARQIVNLAGADIDMVFSKGTLLITGHRLNTRVINRLRRAADSDILVPGGTVSVLGTTSAVTDNIDRLIPTIQEVDQIIDDARNMAPSLAYTRYIRAYAGVRPLIRSKPQEGEGGGDSRSVSRGFALLDHLGDGLDNLITITGGKLTTYRLMAEKTANLVCRRLGLSRPCLTRTEPLPDTQPGKWTQPGMAPSDWMRHKAASDIILCECEMEPDKCVDTLLPTFNTHEGQTALTGIGLRSRVGKGPCQGAFCGTRITAYMYEKGHLQKDDGLLGMQTFFNDRFKGQRSICWDAQLAQVEFAEALHCGVFGLELHQAKPPKEGSDV